MENMKTQDQNITLEIRPYNRAKLFLGGSADDVDSVADCDSQQSAEIILRAVNEHAALVAVAKAANNQMLSMRGVGVELATALANLAAVRKQN